MINNRLICERYLVKDQQKNHFGIKHFRESFKSREYLKQGKSMNKVYHVLRVSNLAVCTQIELSQSVSMVSSQERTNQKYASKSKICCVMTLMKHMT